MSIPQVDTNLRRSRAFLGEFADLVNDLVGSGFEPCWRRPRVWDRTGRYTFAVAMKATHDF